MSASVKWLRRQRRRLVFLSLAVFFGIVSWFVSSSLWQTSIA
jgi:hypothetical protein